MEVGANAVTAHTTHSTRRAPWQVKINAFMAHEAEAIEYTNPAGSVAVTPWVDVCKACAALSTSTSVAAHGPCVRAVCCLLRLCVRRLPIAGAPTVHRSHAHNGFLMEPGRSKRASAREHSAFAAPPEPLRGTSM